MVSGLWVSGLGFMGFGLGVWGLGFKVEGLPGHSPTRVCRTQGCK